MRRRQQHQHPTAASAPPQQPQPRSIHFGGDEDYPETTTVPTPNIETQDMNSGVCDFIMDDDDRKSQSFWPRNYNGRRRLAIAA